MDDKQWAMESGQQPIDNVELPGAAHNPRNPINLRNP